MQPQVFGVEGGGAVIANGAASAARVPVEGCRHATTPWSATHASDNITGSKRRQPDVVRNKPF